MKLLKKIDDRLEEVLLILIMAYFVFAVVAQVVARFVLKVPAGWTEESARYAFIWMTFIGASYATKQGMHIRMDVLETYMKPKTARIFKLVSMLIFLVFLVVMAYLGVRVCHALVLKPQTSAVLKIPLIWVYISLPTGMILSVIRLVQWFYLELQKGKAGEAQSMTEG